MSVNLHLTRHATGVSEMHIICGAAEARACWLPIFQRLQTSLLEYAFSAGLTLDADNRPQFDSELTAVLAAIEGQYKAEDDVVNMVFRARRFAQLLATCSLDEHDVYIG